MLAGAYSPGMNIQSLSLQQRISAVAALVVIVSVVLPWYSIFGINILGVETTKGLVTLVLAGAGLAILGLSTEVFGPAKVTEPALEIVLVVLAGLAALIALVSLSDLATFGLFLTLLAGIAWVAGAVWQLLESRQGEPKAPTGHQG